MKEKIIAENLQIEKIIPGGMSLATAADGKKIFLWGALPGETVTEFKLTKIKPSFSEALALTIINPSPRRVKEKDECYLATSPFQIMDYNYELEIKQSLVQEIFREHGIYIEKPEIITDGEDYFYRNKMEYALYFDKSDEKIYPAFRVRGSHQKIPVTTSSIERPEIFAKAKEIVAELNASHADARTYQSLLLRVSQNGEVSGGLLENHKPHPVFSPLSDTIMGHPFTYSPNGFFQINLPVYELALKEIERHITTKNVLDLYSGVGTIGLSVAGDKNLTLVEVDKSAFKELAQNAKDFKTATPIFAKSEDVTTFIAPDQTVIMDPPRAGCDKKLINALLEVSPEKIIYLSCNPATEARDIKLLLEKYKIDLIKSYNFFPKTPHIENLAILSRI